MILIVETEIGKSFIKERFAQHEYEIILLVFLLLRFGFKNILGYAKYFTEQPVFNLSDTLNIIIGSVVLLLVCAFVVSVFGRLIRSNGTAFEKPALILVALFLACPASLPFLFNTDKLTGTQMLYPFALFVLSILLIQMPFVKWIVPIICALYLIPTLFSSVIFFDVLRKGALLYVPLILLLLFLEMVKKNMDSGKKKTMRINIKSDSTILLFISLLVSVGSYVYTLVKGKSYSEGFYNGDQKLNGYFAASLLIVAPVLVAVGAVLYNAVKNKFPMLVFDVFWRAPILLFLLFRNNYYGLWVPFIVLSSYMLVFYSVQQKNAAMLSAVQKVGAFCLERQFLFFIILIAMASLSNVSSQYLSSTFYKIFSQLPY